MKNLLISLFLVVFFLSACRQATPISQSSGTSQNTLTPILASEISTVPVKQFTPLPSKTPREPRNEPTASVTPLPTIPTFTPTFDVSTIVTVTPAPKAECPKINSQADLELNKVQGYVPDTSEIAPPILDFLNNGGDASKLIQQVNQVYGKGKVIVGLLQDLTNDGVPDVIIKYPGMLIFTCQNGQYQMVYEGGGLASYKILDDLNKNGIPEILTNLFLISNAGTDIILQEWNGSSFSDIGHLGIDGGSQYNIVDWNGDGLSEFIFRGGAPSICCEADLNPWRYKTIIYGWNGQKYEDVYQFFDAPQYRFQAIQDADRETVYGNIETALKLYQDAIFSDKLDWWSADKKHFLDETIIHRFDNPTPTISPLPTLDSTEYPRLAAYAYYRIMLLYIVQNHESDAGTVYNTLQQKFGDDSYGHPYVEMTASFWEAYQSTHKMYDSCVAAIQYAAEHPEILTPLGSNYHGEQSHIYVPADVCPFR